MITLNNFKEYTPDAENYGSPVVPGAQYYIDDAGNDWYKSQSLFSADTFKLGFNDGNQIVQYSDDVSRIVPVGLSVTEVDPDDVPPDMDKQFWLFIDGKIVPDNEQNTQFAAVLLSSLQQEAELVISPLERAVKRGVATDNDVARLNAWEDYSLSLLKVDTGTFPDIEWPEKP